VTLNLNPELIEGAITDKTKAILVVDVFGYPVSMDPIISLAKHYGLAIIEDSCEALGSKIDDKMAGTESDIAVFAFYPNKQITTGEGGMIVTDREELAVACSSMRNQGRGENGLWLHHERLGYNYRLDEMSAALGIVQLKRIESIIEKREKIARMYDERLKKYNWLTLPPRSPRVRQSWFAYVIRLDQKINRDKVMIYLQNCGIGCRPYFTPIHLQPFYQEQFGYKPGQLPITEQVSASTLALPFHNHLGEEEIDYVVEKLLAAVSCQ
ncbi:MAG TPA: DegT/DnrJ/EryC1/StrS family aminotransferase, partial [Clostridia bacterium]|nr:DegT/DnrJ/EryC1/StrS family aminotransferase [Clostridia bacterium]